MSTLRPSTVLIEIGGDCFRPHVYVEDVPQDADLAHLSEVVKIMVHGREGSYPRSFSFSEVKAFWEDIAGTVKIDSK